MRLGVAAPCFSPWTRSTLVCLGLLLLGCLQTMPSIDPTTLPRSSEAATRLSADVEFLASHRLRGRLPGTEGNRLAAGHIDAAFRAAGLQPFTSLATFRQTISSAHGDNIVGYRASSGPRLGWILIGAHYDHLGGDRLGADDNASAVAILLELARSLQPLEHYSVVFAAFNTEENPYFGTPQMGSEFFLAHLPPEIGAKEALQAVIVMDLVGGVQWEPLRDVLFAGGAEKSPGLYRRLRQAMRHQPPVAHRTADHGTSPPPRLSILPVGMHLIEEIPNRGHSPVSDYDAFRNVRVPYLFLSSARTPRYHTPRDQADTLHYDRMAATVRWLDNLLQLMDQDREPYEFEANRVEFADEVETFRRVISHAVNESTLIPGTSRLSLRKLRQDGEWLRTVDVDRPTSADLEQLERISIRFQCLLADYVGCFMF